jgi:hypothetical protein
MKRPTWILLAVILLSALAWGGRCLALPMVITEGTYTPASGDPHAISGSVNWMASSSYIEMFQGMHATILADGLDPIDSHDWVYDAYEIESVYEDHFNFYNFYGLSAPDPYGRDVSVEGTAFYTA